MAKELNKDPINFQPVTLPDDPYKRARQEWDERIGSSRVQAMNWRIVAFGSIVVNVILSLGIIYQSSKSTVTPYVVQVGSDGLVQAAGPARNTNYVPQEKEIKYFLAQLVTKARTIPLDPVIAKQNWTGIYNFLHKAAIQKMNQYMINDKLAEKVGRETCQVEVTVIVPVSKNSYQVRWQERTYGSDGVEKANYKMTGVFSISITPPQTEEELLQNPIGLFVEDLSWSREL